MVMTEPNQGNKWPHGIRVAVLGASGFIGRWVARALCAQSVDVCLVVRDRTTAQRIFTRYGIHANVFETDLGNPEAVRQLFREMRPTATFNLAGYGIDRSERDEYTAYDINAHLVARVCEAVAETRDPDWRGQDIVHVGSALEYGSIGGDLSEDSVANPTTLYGKSKLAGTWALASCCEVHEVIGVTARLFTVYGPGEHPGRLLPSLLEAARMGKPLHLTAGTQRRDFTYVEDIAEGLLRLGLARTEPGEIVNLATGQLTCVRDFVTMAAEILEIPEELLRFGSIPVREEEMEHLPVTLDRLQELIGWVPTTGIRDGVRRTLGFGGASGGG